jgi:hypothetical protein
MPFALFIIGAALIIASVRNTQGDLFTLIQGDFTGPGNYIFWMVSILLIGAIGYVPKAKPISTAFLVLVIVVLFLSKGKPNAVSGGFFKQFSTGITATQKPAPTATAPQSSGLPSLPSLLDLTTPVH